MELNKADASMMIYFIGFKKFQLDMANSIWLNENYHFQTEFARNNQDYYNAEIEEMDIKDPKSSKRINDWVKERRMKK